MADAAFINPATLRLARERAGLDVADLAAKLSVADAESRVKEWERGDTQPSFPQARRIAELTHVPFASLFLEPKSLGSTALPDLRTVGRRAPRFSVDLVEVYRDALRKQAWAAETRHAQGEPEVTFVGQGSRRGATPQAGAQLLHTLLAVTSTERARCREPDDYSRLLIRRAEALGVLVLRSSTVGANTHRPLDPDEFRGFAIADARAPLVFINTADAKSAQVFTLLHELAHLWRGETGISQPAVDKVRAADADAEAFCDQVAADFLVPLADFRQEWDRARSFVDNCNHLRSIFKVSGLVIARRAREQQLVGKAEYDKFVAEQMAFARSRSASHGGPSFLLMVRLRNGGIVTDMIVRAVRGGELLWRDAATLLGVGTKTVAKLIEAQQGGG
ncbi:MAG TPA: XRE family transcriptional regulator [Kofleriaceae bacterium]